MTALIALVVFAIVGSAVLAIFAAISPKRAGEVEIPAAADVDPIDADDPSLPYGGGWGD